MADIFISYASEDRAKAQQLAQVLEGKGWSVWWDPKIPPGKTYSRVIDEALKAARCVLVLWSKASVKSEWVDIEATEGKRREILIPALVQDLDLGDIPIDFRKIESARLVDWKGDKSGHPELDLLLGEIGSLLRGSGLPKFAEALRKSGVIPVGVLGGTQIKVGGQTRQASATKEKPKERITVHPDDPDILIDNQTGLMWTRKDNGTLINSASAAYYAKKLSLGGYSNWRLPTFEELKSIYDPNSKTGTWNWLGKDYAICTVKGFQLSTPLVWGLEADGSHSRSYFDFRTGLNSIDKSTFANPLIHALFVRSSAE